MNRILLLTCIIIPQLVLSQSEVKTSQAFLFTPHIAFHKVGGDMKDRFNKFNSIGMNMDYKFKNNLTIGVDYDWFFGRAVKDNGIFSNITGESGLIIDQNGDFSVINLLIRKLRYCEFGIPNQPTQSTIKLRYSHPIRRWFYAT